MKTMKIHLFWGNILFSIDLFLTCVPPFLAFPLKLSFQFHYFLGRIFWHLGFQIQILQSLLQKTNLNLMHWFEQLDLRTFLPSRKQGGSWQIPRGRKRQERWSFLFWFSTWVNSPDVPFSRWWTSLPRSRSWRRRLLEGSSLRKTRSRWFPSRRNWLKS